MQEKQFHHIERLYWMAFKMTYNDTLYKDVLILNKGLRDRLLILKSIIMIKTKLFGQVNMNVKRLMNLLIFI